MYISESTIIHMIDFWIANVMAWQISQGTDDLWYRCPMISYNSILKTMECEQDIYIRRKGQLCFNLAPGTACNHIDSIRWKSILFTHG